MLELGASEQEPLCVFNAISITSLSRLEVVYHWYWVLRLLLGSLLLVVLNDLVPELDLLLVGFNLLRSEHILAHDCHERLHISSSQIVFSQP